MKAEDKARARGQDPKALSESELAELKRLRKENAELKMDREILLKASVFFAKETNPEPLPVRLRSSRPVPGQSLVPSHQGLPQRLLRLGQPAAVSELCRGRLSGRHHPGDLSALEADLWLPRIHGQLCRAGTRGRAQTRRPADGRARAGRRPLPQEVASRPSRRGSGSGSLQAGLQRQPTQRALGGRHHRVLDRGGEALLGQRQGPLWPRARRLVDGQSTDLRVGDPSRVHGRRPPGPGIPSITVTRGVSTRRSTSPTGFTSSVLSRPMDRPATVTTTRPWRRSGPR